MPPPEDKGRAEILARFERFTGRAPDLETPRRFTDKVLHRVLTFDDPLLPLYADKLTAPYFARAMAGPDLDIAERYAVYRTVTPDDLRALPDHVIVKASHASGVHAIFDGRTAETDKQTADLEAICTRLNTRVRTIKNAQRRTNPDAVIIAEELLTHPDGRIPSDYKFHFFRQPDGGVRWILNLHHDRFGSNRRTVYGDDRQPLPFEWRTKGNQMEPLDPPPRFDRMIELGARIAAGFDYMRVDLYNVEGRIVFSEVTPFTFGGVFAVDPDEWDFRLGDLWHLDLCGSAVSSSSSQPPLNHLPNQP